MDNRILSVELNPEGKTITLIQSPAGYNSGHYALIIADLVRHVARAFRVPEQEVWKIVDLERNRPTTDLHGTHVGEN